MDNQSSNFQTSFIPKKALAEERVAVPRHTSIFTFIATLVFFASIAAAAGIYFYNANIVKTNAAKVAQIAIARNSFEPTLIQTLDLLDRRITDAKTLLGSHIAVSPIFDALEINTLKSIQFTKFSYTTPTDPSAPVMVRMSGRARDYASIALQSDQLATNKNIHNPIFSNLALDAEKGNVTFDLVFSVDPGLVRFKNHVDDMLVQTTAPVDTASPVAPTNTPPTTTIPATTP